MPTSRFAKRALCAVVLILALPAIAYANDSPAALNGAGVWLLISAALVFLMQCGFLALETGFVRSPGAPVTAMKNIVDWCVVTFVWLVFGFGLAFGQTH